MLDMYEYLTDKDIIRSQQRSDLERAIERTRRKLSSDNAKNDPLLQAKWEIRLERQLDNLVGVVGK